jgi:hypothetical protein
MMSLDKYPSDDGLIKKWIVTEDPRLYASREFTEEEKSIIQKVRERDPNELFMIQLSYASEDESPRYIHVITSDGEKFKVHDDTVKQ